MPAMAVGAERENQPRNESGRKFFLSPRNEKRYPAAAATDNARGKFFGWSWETSARKRVREWRTSRRRAPFRHPPEIERRPPFYFRC